MRKLRVSPQARAELDNIWLYIARESGSPDIASRFTDGITERFWLLNRYPNIGRRRDDLRPGLRSFAAGDYVIIYRVEGETVLIVHILHGSRDIGGLLG
jgi:toxin ParE1/3/4